MSDKKIPALMAFQKYQLLAMKRAIGNGCPKSEILARIDVMLEDLEEINQRKDRAA